MGEKIEVLVDPNNAQDFKINGFWEIWIIPFFLFVFGAVIFLIGAVYQWGKIENAEGRYN
jgi:hypothetical protein